MKTTTAPEHGAVVDSPPRNCTGALEQRFLTGADYQAMAHDLPLIKRTISRHALTLHGAVLMQGQGNRFQELANVAELGTQAAVAVREFCQAMEAFSRRRYPKALWLHGYAELDEDQDPFEWLPQIVKVRKSITPPTGATTE
jgi:hypothetical protein